MILKGNFRGQSIQELYTSSPESEASSSSVREEKERSVAENGWRRRVHDHHPTSSSRETIPDVNVSAPYVAPSREQYELLIFVTGTEKKS